jgi:hypothetical protein
MDPEIAWRSMLEALGASEMETACAYAEDLLDWIRRGGFPPRIVTVPTLPAELQSELDKQLAMVACEFVLQPF